VKPTYLIILLVINFFWAAVYAAYKVIDQSLPESGSTGLIVTLRFGMAGVILLLAWPWLPGARPRGLDFIKTCLMGILVFVLGQRLQVYGNQVGSAGNSAVLMSVEPLITSVAAAIFLHESIGPRRIAGFALCMAGIALLNGIWRPGFQWTGIVPSLIFISSFVCESAYSVVGKPVIQRAGMMKVLTVALVSGLVVNLAIDGRATLATARQLSPMSWGLLLGLAVICTVIGYTIWFLVIRDCPVNLAALTVFTQPIYGVAFAAWWLGEKLHWGHLFGSLAILAGVVLGLSRQLRFGRRAAEGSPAQ
jgi:drug/metabolite transporter (DMT)-like permease